MKSLKTILQKFDPTAPFAFGNMAINLPNKCIHTEKTICELFENVTPKEPTGYELEESFTIILREWKNKNSLRNVSRQHIRRLPWLLFYRPLEQTSFLSDDILFLEHIFNDAKYINSSSRIIALLNEFFRVYPQKNREFWFKALQNVLQNSNSPRLANYLEKIENYSLLTIEGPQKFAEAIYTQIDTENVINNQWFQKSLDYTNFLYEASSILLAKLYNGLVNYYFTVAKLNSICRYLCPQSGSFRFENLKGLIAESLLLPFKEISPPADVKEFIKQFLISNYGNPYIRPGSWNKVAAEAQNILLSWLTEETLEDFFDILDITAGEQWQYRRDFWQAILEKNLIRKAWVILGSKARNLASRLPQRTWGYGKLFGASGDQSVLLMEIGPFIVAEWSHSGKCRFWYLDNQFAPGLFKKEYDSQSLRYPAYADFAHFSSDSCRWQSEIADFLRREVNARLSKGDYFKGRY